jgi:hypothetical protein
MVAEPLYRTEAIHRSEERAVRNSVDLDPDGLARPDLT